jgi:hypothetical protein
MNKIIPIVLLFGGLTIFSYSTDKAFTTVLSEKAFPKASSPTKYKPAIISLSTMETEQAATLSIIQSEQLISANLEKVQTIEKPKPPAETKKEFNFENVNGISLYDDVKAVIDKLGQPLTKENDPFFAELEVYAYPEMNIGFSDGIVSYVEVLVAAGTVNIDGVSIPIKEEELINALGAPDFVAEDGIVFQRNTALVKLFKDIETHQVTSLHFYHQSNI